MRTIKRMRTMRTNLSTSLKKWMALIKLDKIPFFVCLGKRKGQNRHFHNVIHFIHAFIHSLNTHSYTDSQFNTLTFTQFHNF